MKLDRDDDGVPLHDSEEGRAMSAARRLALRDAAPDLLAAASRFIAAWDADQDCGALLDPLRAAVAKATTG